MPEREVATKVRDSGIWRVVRKRWRAWLRAVHRDIGYLAIGFTVIYAVSGIAHNHIEDWGEVSYATYEKTISIAPIAEDAPDSVAVKSVTDAAGLGTPTGVFRAGDEVRLEYANGAKVTAIGDTVTIQGRERRAFIGAANWLHTARNRSGWRYVADAYALLLLYLAISGIFMIKGRLGLRWRGALLITIGVAVPITAVLLSSPNGKPATPAAETLQTVETSPAKVPPPAETTRGSAAETAAGSAIDESGIKFLPPDEE